MGSDPDGWTSPVIRAWRSVRNFLTNYVPLPSNPRSIVTSTLMLLAVVVVVVAPRPVLERMIFPGMPNPYIIRIPTDIEAASSCALRKEMMGCLEPVMGEPWSDGYQAANIF